MTALLARKADQDTLDEALALVAKALGHPARIQIVKLLLERKNCIGGDIVEQIGLAQSTVSEHLRILKAAGLITGEIERPRVCYSLNADRLRPLAELLSLMIAQHSCDSGNAACCTPAGCAD